MGFLDLNNTDNKRYLKQIKTALARRGLKPELNTEWEIHGPHQNMPIVLVGAAYNENNNIFVAICPRAVYQIDTPNDWWRMEPDMQLKVGEKL